MSSGHATSEEIPNEYKGIKTLNKFTRNIKGIINLTQKDNIGGTGDIGIINLDGSIEYYSITQWKGKPSKCISNSSARKWYNLNRTDETININDRAYEMAIDYRKNNLGNIPNKRWKKVRGGKCPGARMMCEHLAKEASKSWNGMTKEDKKKSLRKFIDLDNRLTPNANGIIYWNKNKSCIEKIYKWELNINIEDYLDSYNDGIYIYHGKNDNYILKTQTKYNNGIIEGMSKNENPEDWNLRKSKSYMSSWNVNAPDLTKIFKITEIRL